MQRILYLTIKELDLKENLQQIQRNLHDNNSTTRKTFDSYLVKNKPTVFMQHRKLISVMMKKPVQSETWTTLLTILKYLSYYYKIFKVDS